MKLNLTLFLAYLYAINICATEKISIQKNKYQDYTPYLYEILQQNKGLEIELSFEKGIYHFYPEKAYEKYLKISNNDNGSRRIALPIINFKSFTLKGNQSSFIFHGGMVPFVIENVAQLSLEGFDLSWDLPFTFEGTVISNHEEKKTFTLQTAKEASYQIKRGRLYLKGYDWEAPSGQILVFDKEKRRPYYNTKQYVSWANLVAKEIKPRIIQFSKVPKNKKVPPVGAVCVDKGIGEDRKFPAFRLYKSSNIELKNINVYNSGAMALIGEKLNTVTLDNFNVTVPKNSDRMISATADATHFINCKGLIHYKNCLFENMLDDASNVHGTYMKVENIIDDTTVGLRFNHQQQQGFDFAEVGDEVNFINRTDLQGVQKAIVTHIEQINEGYYKLKIDQKLSDKITTNSAIENSSWSAALRIENCTVRQNRARSLLISTNKKVEVLNSYFSSMMAGIRICGDANHWFESGPVTQVTIKGNTFEDLAISGAKPQAILQIDPVISKAYRKENYYHKNIIFENNTVKTFDPLIIYAINVDGLTIKNNTFIKTNTYPTIFGDLANIDVQNCANVTIENNQYSGDRLGEISLTACKNTQVTSQKGFLKKPIEKPNKYFYQK